jgi:hypothetical protein
MKWLSIATFAWLLFGACSIAVFDVLVWPQFEMAATLLSTAHDAYTQANDDDMRVREAASVVELRRRVAFELSVMRWPDRRDTGFSGALASVANIERSFGVTVLRFEPEDARTSDSGRRIAIELQGPFQRTILAVAALSKGPSLLRIEGLRIERENAMSSSVDAVVHVVLYDGSTTF